MTTKSRLVHLPNQQSNATELNEGQEWGCDCLTNMPSLVQSIYLLNFKMDFNQRRNLFFRVFEASSMGFFVYVIINNTSLALTEEKLPPLAEGEFFGTLVPGYSWTLFLVFLEQLLVKPQFWQEEKTKSLQFSSVDV